MQWDRWWGRLFDWRRWLWTLRERISKHGNATEKKSLNPGSYLIGTAAGTGGTEVQMGNTGGIPESMPRYRDHHTLKGNHSSEPVFQYLHILKQSSNSCENVKVLTTRQGKIRGLALQWTLFTPSLRSESQWFLFSVLSLSPRCRSRSLRLFLCLFYPT